MTTTSECINFNLILLYMCTIYNMYFIRQSIISLNTLVLTDSIVFLYLQINMKEQDKSLMKQFIELRSTIVQLRCMYEFNSSCSDISSMSGSNMSLDDSLRTASPYGSPGLLSPIHADLECLEFRSRTSSLLTPKRSPVTRIKWKSNEYI